MAVNGYKSAGLRRRQFARKVKWYVGISSTLFIVVGLIYLVGFSPLFSVGEIKVIGAPEDQRESILDVLRPQVVAARLGGLLGLESFFSWNDGLHYEDVRADRVDLVKSLWGRRIEISVHPRQRYAIWCTTPDEGAIACYWVDGGGIVFEPAPIPAGQLVTALFDSATGTTPLFGRPVIGSDYFAVIKAITESLPKLDLSVSQIIVDRSLEEVRIQTLSGTTIVFSLRFDPTTSALPALKKLIDSPGISNMRTIDFTVENRVFYTAK